MTFLRQHCRRNWEECFVRMSYDMTLKRRLKYKPRGRRMYGMVFNRMRRLCMCACSYSELLSVDLTDKYIRVRVKIEFYFLNYEFYT
jgi:hypothetical protein